MREEKRRQGVADEVRRRVAEVTTATARQDLTGWLDSLRVGLAAGEHAAGDQAFAFLELDVYLFRSGYERARLVRAMSSAPLSADHRVRARSYVLACVDGSLHCDLHALAMLAGAVADNQLRRDLRARLHAADLSVVRRAVMTLDRVRHPGYTPDDLVAVRAWVMDEVASGRRMTIAAERAVRWVWTPAWETELRAARAEHGVARQAANLLLDHKERQRRPRSGP